MAEMNRINSFKSFTEVKNAEKTNKLREENQAKRKQLSQKFESLLDELEITSIEELDEETKKLFLSKVLGEDHSENPNDKYTVRPCDKPGTPFAVWEGDVLVQCFKTEEEAQAFAKKENKEQGLEEGNAFIFAASKAKQAGNNEFEFNGKTYKVTLKTDTGLKESRVTEAKDWEIGKDYPSYGVVVGIKRNGDICEVSFDSGENIVFRDTGAGWVQESLVTEGKFKVDDLVYNTRTKTVGIVRIGEDRGEVKTDADGNVNSDELEIFNPYKNPSHQKAKVAPSTEKEVNKRGLFNPFKNESLVNESHFKIGDKVKCKDSGKTGEVVKLDKEDGADDEKYYTVKVDGGAEMKYAPNELTKESTITEGKDDFMARFGSANINLKKGYKHHTEDELNDLYDKLGDLVKTLKVKDVTLVFESVNESTITEAEIKSDEEFQEYAFTVLKKAFGDDFDEAKAQEVVDGILKKCDGDYGACVGMLTSSLGE